MGRKWANIEKKKGAADKLRGQIYTKILFEVQKAVKSGGDDASTNFLLRIALEKCKKNNVPKDNIDRAIKKGLGGDDDGFEEVTYEGYGLDGVAIFVETSTNNTTRTVANVRSYFNKAGGSLGTTGTLQFIFTRKAVFEVPQGDLDEDEFTLEMIDCGAEEIELEDGIFEVSGPMEVFGSISKKLEEMKLEPEEAGLQQIPTTFKEISDESYLSNMKLIEKLEADDDVVTVYHNIQFSEHFNDL
ncbi:YebC/PmpR family DNA-binding transcriptional regulator [Halobacteriovorax sp. JY17]|uniref:YebC/PmpR family DNA-binding transcriptional regulator n=1 Tax=Halobacteriovorax sp. JY17 TaxID=2014617 RepID=UPI000C56BD1A|nr:YebC/PmpR family DNA-binding transcriptional regulator [Halobacteriovorax sp. JY17]PIK16392.1 MAG: YebC/PmpR family DNA-binding transcriptional regulator [Halobacteriovorax sp. JY17]